MARRLPNQEVPQAQPAPQSGGSPGMMFPPEAAKQIANPEIPTSSVGASLEETPQELRSKKYKVTNDRQPDGRGFPVLLNGTLTHFAKGKIVDSGAYDVDQLRRQGVELEEIPW